MKNKMVYVVFVSYGPECIGGRDFEILEFFDDEQRAKNYVAEHNFNEATTDVKFDENGIFQYIDDDSCGDWIYYDYVGRLVK